MSVQLCITVLSNSELSSDTGIESEEHLRTLVFVMLIVSGEYATSHNMLATFKTTSTISCGEDD